MNIKKHSAITTDIVYFNLYSFMNFLIYIYMCTREYQNKEQPLIAYQWNYSFRLIKVHHGKKYNINGIQISK